MLKVIGGSYSRIPSLNSECPTPSTLKDTSHFEVNSFEMAETETTVWQFNLFLNSIGKQLHPSISPVQGTLACNFVSWLDALKYSNWLSNRTSLNEVYLFPELVTDDNLPEWDKTAKGYRSVSYTHLTLPTNREV